MLSAWTQVVTEGQHHREGNMSLGFKGTWSRLGEGFSCSRINMSKGAKGDECNSGSIRKGVLDVLEKQAWEGGWH